MDKATTSSIDTIAKTCIAVRLRLLNRVVTNFYDDALRPLGLKVSQLNILIVTARLGLARPAQVCDILQLDASTLSRNVKPLQTHGWLEVVPGEDARTQPWACNGLTLRLRVEASSCRISQTWPGRARPSLAVTMRMFSWLAFRPSGRRASS